MLRRSRRLFHFSSESFGSTSSNMIGYTGGLGAHGNLYTGRVNPEDHGNAPNMRADQQNVHLYQDIAVYRDEDPVIRAKLDKCPYFALCDMCVWQGMAPTFLDPGLLTREEHQLLLLWSRAYYEKWREIHSVYREFAPKARIKLGRFTKCAQVFEYLKIDLDKIKKAQQLFFDDASLIAMTPNLWVTAHLDDTVRDHLTGRVLRKAGFRDEEVEKLARLLDEMRTLLIVREDLRTKEELVVSFRDAGTLHDMYNFLGLDGAVHQIKCRNYSTKGMPKRVITIGGEDDFFDFMVDTFYEFNPAVANCDKNGRFYLEVDPQTKLENENGIGFAV